MPVPSNITDLDTNANNNSPQGTETAKGSVDNYFRTAFAFIRQVYNRTLQATETVQGTAEVATQAETDAGTDDARIVTSKKLRWGIAYSLGPTGYIAAPSWFGGWIIQWAKTITTNGSGVGVFTHPIAFTTARYLTLTTVFSSTGAGAQYISSYDDVNDTTPLVSTPITARNGSTLTVANVGVLAIGK